MADHTLIVALGPRRYRVERPFGSWPQNAGFVTDVAVDEQGDVLVLLRHDPLVEPNDARVIRLAPDGAFRGSWGGREIADSHLLTVDSQGRVLVVDRDMHEVIVFDAAGQRLSGLGQRGAPLSPFNHPSDVAVAPWGEIFVSDGYAASKVHRFAADGRHILSWGHQGTGDGAFGEPHALWAFGDGRIAVVDRIQHRVKIFDRDGRHMQSWEGFYRPVAIWGDKDGNSFVTDQTPNLHMIDAQGTLIGRCRPVLNGAHGIFGTPSGDLFLAESNPSRISRLVRLADQS
jgi:hypothetical protein